MNCPWFSSYDDGVPRRIDVPDTTLHELLFRSAKLFPQKTAIIEGDNSIRYAELAEKVRHFAHGIKQTGISRGKRVAIILPNQINFITAYFGCLAAGCVVVALNPSLTAPEYKRIFSDSRICGVICQLEQVNILAQTGIFKKHVLQVLVPGAGSKNPEGCVSFDEVIASGKQAMGGLPVIRSGDPAIFQYTGGTTGVPKAAVALHRNVVANVIQFSNWLPALKEEDVTVLAALPLFHVYGMVLSMCLGVYWGATILIPPSMKKPETIISAANQHRVNYAPLAPSMIRSLAMVMEKDDLHVPSLRVCISGSAALLDQDKHLFEKHIGGVVLEGYGLSEAPTATHCNPMQKRKNASIGLPLPGVQCKIRKSLTSCLFKREQSNIGELFIKGPQVMQKYNRDWGATINALRCGWLRTGDYATMDDEGYFFIAGRKKEMIKVNGLQVWPKEIEDVIAKIDFVKEAAVAGIADRETGERVIAWIVLNDGSSADVRLVQDHCREYLARYKLPSVVRIVKELPKNQVGKVLKRVLVKEYLEDEKRAL